MISPDLKTTLTDFLSGSNRITVLTGAGISAESGVPTFRGPEGYWTVGSKVYQPQEIATHAMFRQQPDEVWKWFLYRRGVCRRAQPNAGHLALVNLEMLFGNRFTLITQNVDGLHLRAGNSLERTYQIHGNLDYMRCAEECSTDLYPIPETVVTNNREEEITEAMWRLLKCPRCGSMTRPHVLWWDEYYDEEFYRFQSSLGVALETGLLIIVGTSGATNLPNQVAAAVIKKDGVIIDVNIEKNRFSAIALRSNRGFFIQQPGGTALPEIVKVFQEAQA